MSLSDIVNNQASISVTGDEYYTGSVEVSVVINSAKDVSTAFTGLTNIEFDGYNPETYQQVISVLRTMGYTEDKVSYDSLNISIDSNNSTIIISAKTGSQIYTGSMTVPYIVTNMNTATKQDLGDVFAGVTSIKDENGTSANNQSEAKSDLIKMGYTQDKISYSYLNITVTKTFYSPVY
ncbi:hypothetical protein FACS1894166_09590 [Bacilli bacterium]|nr:hypothetical protein FACS1894166_09590 [Bacilli bacterium]